ncbi:transposase [Candidatus Synechococcus calcipolaris G9]|uniref:Transposase n=1 Tax=Candidatus Synechococcus calcipolaris G9 TaxID=1497997 RepID=A0ABT6EZG9_9SYNE|nr:transposase [Candidatus Synechococcus calcipolaris]MDG2990973.1 transposase [Candidatus Synechococcus calcipolaris G9]
MLILESKLKGKDSQFSLVNEAIRTVQFVRNKALRFWMEGNSKSQYDLNKYCAVLAKEFEWAKKLNSQARQAAAERAWSAIARFFDNCKKSIPGKKGYPKFQKDNRSVEYKTTGWKLSDDRKSITFTDGFGIGSFKLLGSRDLNFYSIDQIKRVRIVRRADGYYCQFCIAVDREVTTDPTGNALGIDLGLKYFLAGSDGCTVENPRCLRKSEQALKRLQRQISRKAKGSKNRIKARKRLAKKHLQISRQRKDFVVKTARALILSSDLLAYENLQVRNMVKNHSLAKSISDASWGMFVQWLGYFGKVFGKVVVPVPPQFTSQECANCGHRVPKTLSTRTHTCPKCGYSECRDVNAARVILQRGLKVASEQYPRAVGNLTLGESLVPTLSNESCSKQTISMNQESPSL